MIGHLYGEVLFSDGQELILMLPSGMGHQLYCSKIYPEGSKASLYTSLVIRENAHELYGHASLREKKLFELLLTVKNVGAKSAFALMSALGTENIIQAIMGEDKALLKKAPGVGDKAASQIILDLSKKILKVRMYENKRRHPTESSLAMEVSAFKDFPAASFSPPEDDQREDAIDRALMMEETLMACQELGFKSDAIIPKVQRILNEIPVMKTEQLIHLVLKEM